MFFNFAEIPAGKNLAGYVIPDNVTTVGNYAFFGHKNARDLIIPETVKTIGECALDERESCC